MKKKFYFFLADYFAPILLKIFRKTFKLKVIREEIIDEFLSGDKKFILVFWHGKMLLPVIYHEAMGFSALVSQHSDGEIIARIMGKLGYRLIRGSSTRGGSKAFREMLKLLGNNGKIMITPDGPRGPLNKVKMGTVVLAKMAETPVIPVSFSCNKKKVIKSWDKFNFIKPFSKVVMAYAPPVTVEKKSSKKELENKMREVEDKLISLDNETEKILTENTTSK